MNNLLETLAAWRATVADITNPNNADYHKGRIAGIDEAISAAKGWVSSVQKFDGCDGCSTGDCPHSNESECVQAQAKIIAHQAADIASLAAALKKAEEENARLKEAIQAKTNAELVAELESLFREMPWCDFLREAASRLPSNSVLDKTNRALVASIKTNMQEALNALQFDDAAYGAQMQAIGDFASLAAALKTAESRLAAVEERDRAWTANVLAATGGHADTPEKAREFITIIRDMLDDTKSKLAAVEERENTLRDMAARMPELKLLISGVFPPEPKATP